MYIYNLVRTRMFAMEVVNQLKGATENSLDLLNNSESSWKYVENMYYECAVGPSLLKSLSS